MVVTQLLARRALLSDQHSVTSPRFFLPNILVPGRRWTIFPGNRISFIGFLGAHYWGKESEAHLLICMMLRCVGSRRGLCPPSFLPSFLDLSRLVLIAVQPLTPHFLRRACGYLEATLVTNSLTQQKIVTNVLI